MEDERIWNYERSLWTGDSAHYHELIDDSSLFVVPQPPFMISGDEAATAMAKTPRWTNVEFSEQQIMRPQEGLIVIAYHAKASKEGDAPYEANCTSTLRWLSHDEWRVVQHQQTPPITATA